MKPIPSLYDYEKVNGRITSFDQFIEEHANWLNESEKILPKKKPEKYRARTLIHAYERFWTKNPMSLLLYTNAHRIRCAKVAYGITNYN